MFQSFYEDGATVGVKSQISISGTNSDLYVSVYLWQGILPILEKVCRYEIISHCLQTLKVHHGGGALKAEQG